jgi:hypothetical protein
MKQFTLKTLLVSDDVLPSVPSSSIAHQFAPFEGRHIQKIPGNREPQVGHLSREFWKSTSIVGKVAGKVHA